MPLWSATLENFTPNKLYFKVRPLVDNVCTTDTDVATWHGILGSLTGDLIAEELGQGTLCTLPPLSSSSGRHFHSMTFVLSNVWYPQPVWLQAHLG